MLPKRTVTKLPNGKEHTRIVKRPKEMEWEAILITKLMIVAREEIIRETSGGAMRACKANEGKQ